MCVIEQIFIEKRERSLHLRLVVHEGFFERVVHTYWAVHALWFFWRSPKFRDLDSFIATVFSIPILPFFPVSGRSGIQQMWNLAVYREKNDLFFKVSLKNSGKKSI